MTRLIRFIQTEKAPKLVYGLAPLWLALLLIQGFSAPATERSTADKALCAKGHVWLAKEPTKIRFSVGCHLTDARKVARLSLARFSVKKPNSGSDIHRVSKSLNQRSLGMKAGRGSCVLREDGVSCVVRGQDRVSATGWIEVSKGNRCDRRVALSVTRPPKCSGEYCDGVLDVDYLWKKLPTGC
jgi:hypothetical protein